MSAATLYKQGKLRTQLLPADALIEVAKAMEQGAVKHGARNWEVAGKHYTDIYGALTRHAFDWFDGKNADHESGLDPMAHVAACALMLLAMKKRGIGTDDRVIHTEPELPLQPRIDAAFKEIEEENRAAAESLIEPGAVVEIEAGLQFRLEKNHPSIWEITEIIGDGKFNAKEILKAGWPAREPMALQMMTIRAIAEVVKRPAKTNLRCVHCPADALPGKELCEVCDSQ